mgnify:FL=1
MIDANHNSQTHWHFVLCPIPYTQNPYWEVFLFSFVTLFSGLCTATCRILSEQHRTTRVVRTGYGMEGIHRRPDHANSGIYVCQLVLQRYIFVVESNTVKNGFLFLVALFRWGCRVKWPFWGFTLRCICMVLFMSIGLCITHSQCRDVAGNLPRLRAFSRSRIR